MPKAKAADKVIDTAYVTAAYVQRGEALDYRNTTEKEIPEDAVLVIGNRVGIAGGKIPPGQLGSVHMVGVFRVKKSGGAAIEQGEELIFNGTGAAPAGASSSGGETADGETGGETGGEAGSEAAAAAVHVPMGYAAASSGTGDATVLVKLPG